MDFVVSGQITAVFTPVQGVSQRTGQPWVSQSYLLCYEQGQYPKSISFSVFGEEKIKQMAIQQGEQLTVHINIEAKQGQKGYFNDVSAWKVERQGQQQAMPQAGYAPQTQVQYQQQTIQQPMQAQVQSPFPPQQPAPGQAIPPQPAPQPAPQQGGLPF